MIIFHSFSLVCQGMPGQVFVVCRGPHWSLGLCSVWSLWTGCPFICVARMGKGRTQQCWQQGLDRKSKIRCLGFCKGEVGKVYQEMVAEVDAGTVLRDWGHGCDSKARGARSWMGLHWGGAGSACWVWSVLGKQILWNQKQILWSQKQTLVVSKCSYVAFQQVGADGRSGYPGPHSWAVAANPSSPLEEWLL